VVGGWQVAYNNVLLVAIMPLCANSCYFSTPFAQPARSSLKCAAKYASLGDAAKHSAHSLQILIRLNFVHEQQRLYRTRRLYAYATVLLVVGELLRRLFGQKPELTRKIIHIAGCGFWRTAAV